MSPLPPSPSAVDALAVMRDRYRATSVPRTIAELRELAARLLLHPDAPEVLTTVRRELHRVRGTAGTYGFSAAATLCAAMEERAVTWAAGAERLPASTRGTSLAALTDALDEAFAQASAGAVAGTGDAGPMDVRPALAAPAAPQSAPEPAPEHDAVPDVIVVEDDADLARVVEFGLETAGATYRTYAAGTDAVEALCALPRGGRRPIVLLDIDLPGLDGHSVHERLAAERPGGFGVVFMTSHAGEGEQLRAYRAGALDFVQKPVSLRVVLAKLPIWQRAMAAAPSRDV